MNEGDPEISKEIDNISHHRTENEAKPTRFKHPFKDDDSISTLGGNYRARNPKHTSNEKLQTPTRSDQSVTSTVTMETVLSLESKFNKMIANSNAMVNSKFDNLFELISTLKTSPPKDDQPKEVTIESGASADELNSGNRS